MATRDKEKRRLTAIVYREKKRREVLQFLGNKCIVCGFSDPRALQIDHVNSDGWKERKFSLPKKYKSILDNPERYQLLCANCNWIKRHESGETPGPKSLKKRIPICHPEREYQAKGLCHICYNKKKAWAKQNYRPRNPRKKVAFQIPMLFPSFRSGKKMRIETFVVNQ